MKLYVGNLPFKTSEEELKNLFSSYGDIEEAIIIRNKYNDRSKGFGFVTLSDDSSAQKAIAELNNKEFQGRELKISEARPMEERPERNFDKKEEGSTVAEPMDSAPVEDTSEEKVE